MISSVQVGGGPTALAIGDGAVWVANNEDATVSRLDPQTAHVQATIPVNSGPVALAFADGVLWVAGEHAHTVGRLEPDRDAMTRTDPDPGIPGHSRAVRSRPCGSEPVPPPMRTGDE